MEREYFIPKTDGSLALKVDRPQPPFDSEIKVTPGLGKGLNDIRGLDITSEMTGFLDRYNHKRKEGEIHSETIQLSINELEANLRSWTGEFPQGALFLPMTISQAEENGRRFIVNSYDGIRIVEKTTSRERNGATLKASERMEEFFDKEDGDGIGVINSVSGWTGFLNEDGSDFEYLDHQLLVFERRGGVLRGLTLVSDLTREQARQLSINLGIAPEVLGGRNEHEEIENIVKNPSLLKKGSQRFKTILEIAEEIMVVRGGRHDFCFELPDKTFKYVQVSEMLFDIEKFERGEDLLKFSPEVEKEINKLKEFILGKSHRLGHPIIQSLIAQEIRTTALRITRALRTPQLKSSSVGSIEFRPREYEIKPYYPQNDNFEEELLFLQHKTMGCAGGVSFESGFEIGLDIASTEIVSYQPLSWTGSRRRGRGRRLSKENGVCKVCGVNQAVKGGCGYCQGCEHKAG